MDRTRALVDGFSRRTCLQECVAKALPCARRRFLRLSILMPEAGGHPDDRADQHPVEVVEPHVVSDVRHKKAAIHRQERPHP